MRHQLSTPKPAQQLYQVSVACKKQRLVVGPAMMEEACKQFASKIAEQIALGKEKIWRDPQVTPVIHLEH